MTETEVRPPDLAKPEQSPGEISSVVEHLFRDQAGKMVATLTSIFGLEHLALAEDVVQEALARALQTWPFYGVPNNPAAWIMRTARNLALDVVRRQKVSREKEPEVIRLMDRSDSGPDDLVFDEEEITDDRLRLMFVCCHPAIAAADQVAFALKTLCGFSITEISRAFLTTDAAIAKRLTRAKQKIRDARIEFEIPAGAELKQRLDGVLQALYFLFNEGYKASSGETLVRQELCREAIRLTTLLAEHPAGNQPKTHALLALMLLNSARFSARVDSDGNLLRLQDQDRSQWDQAMIAKGMFHLAQSAAGDSLSTYHLLSAIAACHCAAKDYASTDWPRILSLYDRLLEFDNSPIIALNRSVAVANVHGPAAAIEALAAIRNQPELNSYYLLHAAQGEFECRLGHLPTAAEHFRHALKLTQLDSERAFLSKRIHECAAISLPT
jgi:RNA polymerase sigma factor (sigma-70 family)